MSGDGLQFVMSRSLAMLHRPEEELFVSWAVCLVCGLWIREMALDQTAERWQSAIIGIGPICRRLVY